VALASRYPVSAFGFLFGMLAMLGVPPTLGFIGRWRLYATALDMSPWLLAIFVLSSVLALVAYTLALTHAWWGPPQESETPPRMGAQEPAVLQATVVALVTLLVAGGLWPQMLGLWTGVRP
jgi:NADH:ubiquinone oxidoreductase subunit 2 (subunit N)